MNITTQQTPVTKNNTPIVEKGETTQVQVKELSMQEQKSSNDAAKQSDKQQLQQIVQQLNDDISLNTKLRFGFHDESSTYYVSVLDAKTDEVIRKYPSEEAMSLASKLQQISRGLIDVQG